MPNSSCFTWVSWQWSVFPAVCWHFPGQVQPQAFPHSLNSNQPPLANIRDIFSCPFRISCNKKSLFQLESFCKLLYFKVKVLAHSRFGFLKVSWDLRTNRHTWRHPLISVVPKAMKEASWGPLKGCCISLKSPSRVRDEDDGVAGSNGRVERFVFKGSLLWPLDNTMIFYLSSFPNIWLLATTTWL